MTNTIKEEDYCLPQYQYYEPAIEVNPNTYYYFVWQVKFPDDPRWYDWQSGERPIDMNKPWFTEGTQVKIQLRHYQPEWIKTLLVHHLTEENLQKIFTEMYKA